MLHTDEYAKAQVPTSSSERQKCILAHEKLLLNLGWDRSRFSPDLARTASRLLSVISFSDFDHPVDLNLLGDDVGSSADAGSSERGTKRAAEPEPAPTKPTKKQKRNATSPSLIAPKTQVACIVRVSQSRRHWVLGRVLRYLPDAKKYEILDDADGEEQVYRVFKKNIRVIPKKAHSFDQKIRVLAVYPHTTVFYPARLVTRRGKYWIVEFDDEDDQDENKFKEVDGRLIMPESTAGL